MGDLDKSLTIASATRPTNVRWRVLALLMAYSALCHFNRVGMSVAGTERIMDEYGISPTRMGYVYSAYLLTYTLCMTPGGWLIDRFGPRFALALMGFGSALFVVLTGVAGLVVAAVWMWPALLLIRSLLGAVTAPIHPAGARAVSFWMPYPTRSLANGLIIGSATIGIAATYPILGKLIDRFDWPMALMFAGGITFLVAALWTFSVVDRPGHHPAVNAAERQLIEGSDPERHLLEGPGDGHPAPSLEAGIFAAQTDIRKSPSPEGETATPPSKVEMEPVIDLRNLPVSLLTNRSLILLTISYAAVGYFEYLFFYWVQYYFDTVLGLGKAEGRIYAMIATLAMTVGMFGGGWLADLAQGWFGRRLGRAVVPVTGMVASAVFLALGLGLWNREPLWVATCFSLAMAAVGSFEGPSWTTAIELGGRRGATAAGIFNTGGNAGGLLAPVVTPLLSDALGLGWQGGFSLAGVFCLLGAVLWVWIDPAERS